MVVRPIRQNITNCPKKPIRNSAGPVKSSQRIRSQGELSTTLAITEVNPISKELLSEPILFHSIKSLFSIHKTVMVMEENTGV